MTTEQREFVRQFATLLQRKYGKSASTASFPIDCQILRVDLDVAGETSHWSGGWVGGHTHLDQIGIPGVSRDAEIIVALFLESESNGCVRRIRIRQGCTFRVGRPKTWPKTSRLAFCRAVYSGLRGSHTVLGRTHKPPGHDGRPGNWRSKDKLGGRGEGSRSWRREKSRVVETVKRGVPLVSGMRWSRGRSRRQEARQWVMGQNSNTNGDDME